MKHPVHTFLQTLESKRTTKFLCCIIIGNTVAYAFRFGNPLTIGITIALLICITVCILIDAYSTSRAAPPDNNPASVEPTQRQKNLTIFKNSLLALLLLITLSLWN